MANWKVTVRHGSDVSRERFDDLEEALAFAREAAEQVVDEGPLEMVKAIRDYGPAQIVNARVEITGKGLLRPPTAGIDIHGDLSIVPYAGGVRRKLLDGSTIPQAIKSLRMALQS